jgi:hypothetical protein
MNRRLNIFYIKSARCAAIKSPFKTWICFLFLIVSLICLPVISVSAQVPFIVNEKSSEFYRGMELFNKEKYPAAIRHFDSFINSGERSNLLLVSDAEYYSAIAALRLFNPDAEYWMMMFIYTYPESPRINEARLELGDYFYQKMVQTIHGHSIDKAVHF